METRFSASEYTQCLPTSTHAAQGWGGLPAQRVFLERQRLQATIDLLERSSARRVMPALPSTISFF